MSLALQPSDAGDHVLLEPVYRRQVPRSPCSGAEVSLWFCQSFSLTLHHVAMLVLWPQSGSTAGWLGHQSAKSPSAMRVKAGELEKRDLSPHFIPWAPSIPLVSEHYTLSHKRDSFKPNTALCRDSKATSSGKAWTHTWLISDFHWIEYVHLFHFGKLLWPGEPWISWLELCGSTYTWMFLNQCTVSPSYPQVPHLQVPPTMTIYLVSICGWWIPGCRTHR